MPRKRKAAVLKENDEAEEILPAAKKGRVTRSLSRRGRKNSSVKEMKRKSSDVMMDDTPPPAAKNQKVKGSEVEQIFSNFCGKSELLCDDEKKGITNYLKSMDIDPEDPAPLGLAWHLKAKSFGEFTRQEFLDGWKANGVTTAAKMKTALKEVVKSMNDKSSFQPIYGWLFNYCAGTEKKTLDLDFAMDVWAVILPPHFPLLQQFLDFLTTQKNKHVTKDLWDQTLEFAREVRSDLSNFDDSGAWPSVIDNFVEYVRTKKKK